MLRIDIADISVKPIPSEVEINVAEAIRFGLDLYSLGDYEQAERLFRQIIEVDPLNVHAHNMLGLCKCERKDWHGAIGEFDQALAILRNDTVAVSCNRGMALGEAARSFEAIELFDAMIRAYPDHVLSYLNRGILNMQVKRFAQATHDFAEVLKREPTNIEAQYSRGFCNLVLGNYLDGFRDFEFRGRDEIEPIDAPQWTGKEDLTGKTILVHGEQGLGDNIQFMRYVPRLKECGAHVVMVMPKPIEPFARGCGFDVVAFDRATWPPLDYWVPIMSLAFCFGTAIDSVPSPLAIKYDDRLMSKWLGLIPPPCYNQINVGICWSGNRISKYDSHRSVPVEATSSLFDLPHIRLYSFQRDVRERDSVHFDALKARGLVDLDPHLTDFRETAHAIRRLDLMITCDTSVAHMAGTVGVPTWIMLTDFRTYWLWTHDRQNCPWYPSVKLFRQKTDGDWQEVVERIRQNLLADKAR